MTARSPSYFMTIALFLTLLVSGASEAFAQAHEPAVFQPGEHVETFDFVETRGPLNIYRLSLAEPPLDLEMAWSGSAANILKAFNRETGTSTIFPIDPTPKLQAKSGATTRDHAQKVTLAPSIEVYGGGVIHPTFVGDEFTGFMIVQSDGQVDFIAL